MPTLEASNLSNAEYFKLNGTLSAERIEALLNGEEKVEAVTGIDAYISEAKGCFPSEDFLQEQIDGLNALAKHVRGENKERILGFVQQLEERQSEVNQSAEYGSSELNCALDEMVAAGIIVKKPEKKND